MFKVHTRLSCGLPSESVSESCWTALQRESHGRIWGRPSEMQEVLQAQEVEIQQKRKECREKKSVETCFRTKDRENRKK